MSSETAPSEEIKFFSDPIPGTVEQTITSTQPGRVWFQASYWPARIYNSDSQVTLAPNTIVSVVGRQGLTLLVDPHSEPHETILFPQPEIGVVEQTISPTQSGRVRFDATSWPAQLYNSDDQITLVPDDTVDIVARQGNILLVVPGSLQTKQE